MGVPFGVADLGLLLDLDAILPKKLFFVLSGGGAGLEGEVIGDAEPYPFP